MKKNIYLARQEESFPFLYKIGISKKNPLDRLKELQTGNANKIELITTFITKHSFKMERSLHLEYQQYHVSGEWYAIPDEEISLFYDTCIKKEAMMDFLKKNNYFWMD